MSRRSDRSRLPWVSFCMSSLLAPTRWQTPFSNSQTSKEKDHECLAETGVAQASHHQNLLLVDNLGPRMLVVGCMARTRGVTRPPGQAATAAIPVVATGEFTDATGLSPVRSCTHGYTHICDQLSRPARRRIASPRPTRTANPALLADRATVIRDPAARRIGPPVRSRPKWPEPVELAESRAETLATGARGTTPYVDPHRRGQKPMSDSSRSAESVTPQLQPP